MCVIGLLLAIFAISPPHFNRLMLFFHKCSIVVSGLAVKWRWCGGERERERELRTNCSYKDDKERQRTEWEGWERKTNEKRNPERGQRERDESDVNYNILQHCCMLKTANGEKLMTTSDPRSRESSDIWGVRRRGDGRGWRKRFALEHNLCVCVCVCFIHVPMNTIVLSVFCVLLLLVWSVVRFSFSIFFSSLFLSLCLFWCCSYFNRFILPHIIRFFLLIFCTSHSYVSTSISHPLALFIPSL